MDDIKINLSETGSSDRERVYSGLAHRNPAVPRGSLRVS
jgi:hypothetical protein